MDYYTITQSSKNMAPATIFQEYRRKLSLFSTIHVHHKMLTLRNTCRFLHYMYTITKENMVKYSFTTGGYSVTVKPSSRLPSRMWISGLMSYST